MMTKLNVAVVARLAAMKRNKIVVEYHEMLYVIVSIFICEDG